MTNQETQWEYDKEIAAQITGRIMDGERLSAICADPKMPDLATVQGWLVRYPNFGDAYNSAIDECIFDLACECIQIVHDETQRLAEARLKLGARYLLMERIEAEKKAKPEDSRTQKRGKASRPKSARRTSSSFRSG
jgi:hypothetical protein